MPLEEIFAQLQALGNEKVRAHNKKNGAHDNQFGVRLGDIRNLAKQIKADHELAIALWETGNIDAQLLAILLLKAKNLTAAEMDQIGIHFPELRPRALAIGETLGIYRDYPVSKGCTSPFAPIWINEMVRRQG